MPILDRQRPPLWPAVATSTMSGLCVLAISSAFKPRLLTAAVPLWSLLAAGGVLLGLSYSLLLRTRAQAQQAKRVFLVISAFDQKHYLAELIRNVHSVLERRGYALELKIPHEDYSTVSQLHCLQRILEHRDDYIGGFVIPIIPLDADLAQRDIAEFCGKMAIPVVFLDVEPFENEFHYPARTAYVGYSAAEIGEAAAGWVTEYLCRKQSSCPIVLIIGGDEQHGRQRRFREHLSTKLSPVQIIEASADFNRLEARDVTRRHLKQYDHIDVIFCTNDEMALGAADALLFGNPSTSETIIVGVDGTPQARALIGAGPSPLHATVTQNSYKVAEYGVDLLDRMIRREQVPTRTHLASKIVARG